MSQERGFTLSFPNASVTGLASIDISATAPLCRCGSHSLTWGHRWRCHRGHFARNIWGRSAAGEDT